VRERERETRKIDTITQKETFSTLHVRRRLRTFPSSTLPSPPWPDSRKLLYILLARHHLQYTAAAAHREDEENRENAQQQQSSSTKGSFRCARRRTRSAREDVMSSEHRDGRSGKVSFNHYPIAMRTLLSHFSALHTVFEALVAEECGLGMERMEVGGSDLYLCAFITLHTLAVRLTLASLDVRLLCVATIL